MLYLKSGDRLAGISRGLADGMLRWELAHGSEIMISLDLVERIEYSPIDTDAGDADHDAAPDPGDAGEAAGEGDAGETGAVQAGYETFSSPFERVFQETGDWTKRLEFGARFIQGNTNENFLNAKAQFEREQGTRFTQIDAGGQYGRSRGIVTSNRWFANATVDFNKEGNWVVFVTSRNEHDELEHLDYRGTLSSGLGYRFYNEDDKRLILRAGPGVTHERFFDPTNNRTTPDFLSEIEIRWPLFARTQFEHKTTLHPSLDHLSIFRANNDTGLLFLLDEEELWKLKVGFRHDYNSRPNIGRLPHDYTTSLMLVYTRK